MWETKEVGEIIKFFKTDIKRGLKEEDVLSRINKYGENLLKDNKQENIFIKFIKQFKDFMIIILIIAAIISAVISKLDGSNEYLDSIIIITIVVFNAFVGVIQEYKAEKALEALKNMAAPIAKVKRDGSYKEIPINQVVPGDIIFLEAGSYVPADSRLIKTSNLRIEESSLTGENIPVIKDENVILRKNSAIGDMINMVFASTIVVNGHGEAIVCDTGMNTKVGKIAGLLMENEAPETPIQKKLAQVGKALGLVCLIICFTIFIIGIFKKIEPIEMFMTSVGLAVAAIPEGLPAIVTIVLSIGVTKMARRNSIIRKLPAVETLGSTNVICSDKTGTLTQNKMQVIEEYYFGNNKDKLLSYASMCTDCSIELENKKMVVKGEPTEIAIVNRALENNINKQKLYEEYNRILDIPFDSNRKMMSTIHKIKTDYLIITKGAPDVLLSRCKYINEDGRKIVLDNMKRKKIEQKNIDMAEKALRVIGVAVKKLDKIPNKLENIDIENDLVFIGLIGMMDPPREGVKDAISVCRKAGIKTVMITGDHIATAKAIAKELGILKISDNAITGEELDRLNQKELEKSIMNYSVFARVSPEHKVRIVKAFQKKGNVVAMTGDGVNDAPALKNADIGIAMGKNGTDVAKNAADMILVDDNFVTIVQAIKQGRNIYDNIKKTIHFLISTNIGEIVAIFVGLLLGIKTPLLAIQLLWINLITDSLPAIALGLEKPDNGIMNRKPIDSRKGIFANGLWGKIFIEGIMIGILTLFAFNLGNNLYGIQIGRTMAFVVLGMSELFHSFNIKCGESILKVGIFENKYIVGSFILGTFLQIVVVVIPNIASIFKLAPLNLNQWFCTITISFIPIIIVELQKRFNDFKFGRVIYRNEQNSI